MTDEILNSIVWQEQRRILGHSTSNRCWKTLLYHTCIRTSKKMKRQTKLRTLYSPLIPSFFHVCVRQSIGPLNRAVASRTWDWRRTLVRSNGCSKTFDTMPATYTMLKKTPQAVRHDSSLTTRTYTTVSDLSRGTQRCRLQVGVFYRHLHYSRPESSLIAAEQPLRVYPSIIKRRGHGLDWAKKLCKPAVVAVSENCYCYCYHLPSLNR